MNDVIDWRKEVFTRGINMLMAEGMSEGRARSMVGKWRQLAGNEDETICELLDRACQVDPAVLSEWMVAALGGKKSNRIRYVGDHYIIPPGTDQWDAWHRFFVRLNDPRVYTKGELTVPSLWPR